MSTGKEKIIPILAITVLLIGSFSTFYVHANKTVAEKDTITINNQKFTIQELFESVEVKTIGLDEGDISGLALDKLIIFSNVNCPSCHKYTIIAEDSYQKTVGWEDMKKGIITEFKRTYFEERAHAFWIYNVVEIEVI